MPSKKAKKNTNNQQQQQQAETTAPTSDQNTSSSSSKDEDNNGGVSFGKGEQSGAQQKKTIQEALATLSLLEAQTKKGSEGSSATHAFWDYQPVPKIEDEIKPEESGSIDSIKTVEEVQKEPFALLKEFEWCEMNIDDEKEINEIYVLLTENYVEDDDNMFRFDYSIPFLQWALKPPGFLRVWHVGVRVVKSKKLVGFITGIPATISIYDKVIKMVEINFLCVHKKLRDKRLAPVLIKEITRRVNLTNIWQATYTAGKVLPKPIGRCRYYHRSLNPKKLIDVGFSHLAPRMTIARAIRLFSLPDKPTCPRIRPCEKKDVISASKLLNTYLQQFHLKAIFEPEEFEHWFLPRKGIVNTYVITDSNGKVTDLVSFYTLPSTIIGNQNYKTLKAAYSYYNVATTVPLTDLVRDALVFAKKEDFDVFNCLDIMHNESFLKDLKFGKGDGNLHYYLYNWRCPEMSSEKVGLVLL